MIKIVGKFLYALKCQVNDKNITITLSDEALDYLVEKGYDRKMGARPLQRIIDREIKKPLSKQMLFGDLKNGGKCEIVIQDDKLDISVAKGKYVQIS